MPIRSIWRSPTFKINRHGKKKLSSLMRAHHAANWWKSCWTKRLTVEKTAHCLPWSSLQSQVPALFELQTTRLPTQTTAIEAQGPEACREALHTYQDCRSCDLSAVMRHETIPYTKSIPHIHSLSIHSSTSHLLSELPK